MSDRIVMIDVGVGGRALNDSSVKMSSSNVHSFTASFFKPRVKRVIIMGIILSHEQGREWHRVKASVRHIHLKTTG